MVDRTKPQELYGAASFDQLRTLLLRIRALNHSAIDTVFAQAFHLEQLAWLSIEILNQIAIAQKLGFPSGDYGALDLLKTAERLSIEDHRRMKQILEYRNLSKPERAHFKIHPEALECDLVDLERIIKKMANQN